jgi:hypothetical protein
MHTLLHSSTHPRRRNKEALYKFSRVFQQRAGQADVYDGTTAALVSWACVCGARTLRQQRSR